MRFAFCTPFVGRRLIVEATLFKNTTQVFSALDFCPVLQQLLTAWNFGKSAGAAVGTFKLRMRPADATIAMWGGELRDAGRHPLGYAEQRNINYSLPAARDWYATHQKHYLDDGVEFWWNDEGETAWFTYLLWNEAQAAQWVENRPRTRHFTINRAWQPGMQRFPAVAWCVLLLCCVSLYL